MNNFLKNVLNKVSSKVNYFTRQGLNEKNGDISLSK